MVRRRSIDCWWGGVVGGQEGEGGSGWKGIRVVWREAFLGGFGGYRGGPEMWEELICLFGFGPYYKYSNKAVKWMVRLYSVVLRACRPWGSHLGQIFLA